MVVDDEELVCNMVGDMLEGMGYLVTRFTEPTKALSFYREHASAVDLVIVDMMMPRMSGRELFLALRELHPGVRVLLASGYSLQGEAQAALEQGALGFLQKPFERTTLARKVAEALRGVARS